VTTTRVLVRLMRSERGAALPMVLLVFVLSIGLVGALLTAIFGSSQVSANVRGGIQSEAAAEAGIDRALGTIGGNNPCGVTAPASTIEPVYQTTISCNLTQHRLTISSIGTAPDGSRQKIEAVYPLVPENAPGWLQMSGSVVLQGRGGIGRHPQHPEDDIPTMFLPTGNFSCATRQNIYKANVILAGSPPSGGGATINHNCGEITGDVWARGDISGSGNLTGPKFHPNTPSTHPIFRRPPFVELTKDDIGSYFETELSPANTATAIRNAVQGLSRPGVVDLTGKGPVELSGTYNLRHDVVILADSFTVSRGTQFNGGSGDLKRFWLVVPAPGDGEIVLDQQGSGIGFDDNAVGMVYTSGLVSILSQGNSPWSGTVYAGEVEMTNPNNIFLRYYAMPLPGADLTPGNPVDLTLGALTYQRNVPL